MRGKGRGLLPRRWATCNGARGGFEVDIAWKDGKVSSYRIASIDRRKVTVRVNGQTKMIESNIP